MTLADRLRTHTAASGYNAAVKLLKEAADELDRLAAELDKKKLECVILREQWYEMECEAETRADAMLAVVEAARCVNGRSAEDLGRSYRTRDKEYAVDVLGHALAVLDAKEKGRPG